MDKRAMGKEGRTIAWRSFTKVAESDTGFAVITRRLFIRSCSSATLLSAVTGDARGESAGEVGFSSPGGLQDSPVKLQLTGATMGNVIRFTMDGSAPGAQSEPYRGPLAISKTTVVRAAAFPENGKGPTATRSFIFPKEVIHQDGRGHTSTWGTKEGRRVPAYYEMAPAVVEAAEYRGAMEGSLQVLPTLSIALAEEELFGSEQGIYAHPEATGERWERACSLELLAGGREALQVDCGIRIQGGWNRRPEESPKHSFRIVFKKRYGPGKLRQRIFGTEGPPEFDSLILRAGCNNSWLHWNGVERKRGELIRDQWVRQTMREMGQPSAAGLFVHLYLNGLYWGIYNLTERPDASFAASNLGGRAQDYDSFNADKLLQGSRDGWAELMKRLKSGVKGSRELEAIRELLDLSSFADYMIVNFYGANADWDRSSNWYAARRTTPAGTFRFFIWDAERTLEDPHDNTIDFSDDESPPGIFHQLLGNEGFRALFAQRAKLHLRNDGVLTPARCGTRYKKWADQLDPAIVAESARWGEYRRKIHPYKEGPYELYSRNMHWRPEVRRLLADYFPKRSEILLQQFRDKGLA